MRDPYVETRCYVQRLVGANGRPAPAAGSPEWVALSDEHPAKLIAVLTAGTLHVLTEQMQVLASRRDAAKDAALAVSEAADWTRVAKRIRDRDQAYIKRVIG
ncbi:DUF2742 domain-containing protein [Gordonia sp. VNK1]|uniref:DUF2742 domain-containing protein n=1 Tax=Gordonia oleivorans TaxID=3156618 RepID=UPI0032B396EB